MNLKEHFLEVAKIKKSPHSIALGFAVGTLIAVLPTPGFSIIIGLIVIAVFKNISKIALLAAMIIWNPLVQAPLYFTSFWIGDTLFKDLPIVNYDLTLLEKTYSFARRFLVGNFILAASMSLLSYFGLKFAVDRIKRKNKT